MKIRPILCMALITTAFSLSANAQTGDQADSEGTVHEHSGGEVGVAGTAVYLVTEKKFGFGLHLHYVHNIAASKFGLGLGYERIFADHKHNNIGLVVSFRPVEAFSIDLTPGLNFEQENPGAKFAVHLETTYEFEWNSIHLGPVMEFAYATEDYHVSLGLHLGYDF